MLLKYIKIFISGIAVLLVVELSVLIYVDHGVLRESDTFHVKKVDNSSVKKKEALKIRLADDAKDIKASYDGKYLSYTEDGKLRVMNMSTGKLSAISMDDDMKLDFYKWVYDRNQLIIAERDYSSSYGYYVKLYNLDAEDLEESAKPSEIRNTVNNTSARIILPRKSSHVTDMDFSTSTVMTFLKITDGSGNSIIWRFNVPDENYSLKSVKTEKIGRMQCLKNESELLYEDTKNNKVYVYGYGSLKTGGTRSLNLIGFDTSDNIYLAENDGSGKTEKIYYGGIIENSETDSDSAEVNTDPELKEINLSQAADIDNLYITANGGIYETDSVNHTCKNLVKGTSVKFKGKILSFYENGFITENDGILGETELSK